MRFTIRRAALTGALGLISSQAAQAQDGTFDPAWPVEGRNMYTSDASAIDEGTSVAVRSDGTVVLGGNCQRNDPDLDAGICLRWLHPNGVPLGNGFGGYRKTVLADYQDHFPGNPQIAVHGLAVQRDDRLVLASAEFNGGLIESRVVRLKRAGEFEALADGAYYRRVLFQPGIDPAVMSDLVGEVVIAPDGKIVVAGSTSCRSTTACMSTDSDIGVARFNADMTPDTGFGSDGAQTIYVDLGGANYDTARAVAVQRDGKIVVAGTARTAVMDPATSSGVLARLNPDGGLDASFGDGGKVVISPGLQIRGNAAVPPWVSRGDIKTISEVYAVAIDRRGRILVTGTVFSTWGFSYQFVARFTSAGMLDNSFSNDNGENGILFVDLGELPANPQTSTGLGLILQGDEKILVYGSTLTSHATPNTSVWTMSRLLPSGNSDPSFSTGAYGGYSPPQGPSMTTLNDARGAIIAHGGLILVGRAYDKGASDASYFGVAKLRLDAIFKDGFDSPQ
ncbi:delta-60 repeat domain-containing protein [Dokdonella sp.]|uniref:delta-60 repeat domain-containing protein n=1 Tax=Dokdonella sp. TaxID=2291710 RepID=UPI001B2A496F|nr:delta-60 repeat domain-containing protein [Dokdonella sp.]MBO9663728.1 hypothetical protein [Dokdonella sp.]